MELGGDPRTCDKVTNKEKANHVPGEGEASSKAEQMQQPRQMPRAAAAAHLQARREAAGAVVNSQHSVSGAMAHVHQRLACRWCGWVQLL